MSCRRRALARVAEVTGFRAAVTLNFMHRMRKRISQILIFHLPLPVGGGLPGNAGCAGCRNHDDSRKDRGSSADRGPWAEGLGLDLRKRRVSMMIVFGGAVLAILQSDRLSLHLWRSRSWER